MRRHKLLERNIHDVGDFFFFKMSIAISALSAQQFGLVLGASTALLSTNRVLLGIERYQPNEDY